MLKLDQQVDFPLLYLDVLSLPFPSHMWLGPCYIVTSEISLATDIGGSAVKTHQNWDLLVDEKSRRKHSKLVLRVVRLQDTLGFSVFSKLSEMCIYKFYLFKDF